MEELLRLIDDADRRLRSVFKAMERFEENLVEGSLQELLEQLEASLEEVATRLPEASVYRERVNLLKRYVSAMRVRIVVHGIRVRGLFREAEYIEKHLREIEVFIRRVKQFLASSPRASLQGL